MMNDAWSKGDATPIDCVSAAKQFDRILARVAAGEEFVLLRDGRPVARLLQATAHAAEPSLAEWLERADRLRESLASAGVRITQEEIIAWKNEGHR